MLWAVKGLLYVPSAYIAYRVIFYLSGGMPFSWLEVDDELEGLFILMICYVLFCTLFWFLVYVPIQALQSPAQRWSPTGVPYDWHIILAAVMGQISALVFWVILIGRFGFYIEGSSRAFAWSFFAFPFVVALPLSVITAYTIAREEAEEAVTRRFERQMHSAVNSLNNVYGAHLKQIENDLRNIKRRR